MKRPTCTMRLAAHTVRILTGPELDAVRGGAPKDTDSCPDTGSDVCTIDSNHCWPTPPPPPPP